MSSNGRDIGAVDGFREGVPCRFELDGSAVVVVRKGDEFFAMRDRCPHAGASLSRGRVTGMPLACKPGEEAEYGRDGEIISCPWHGWSFDLRTGRALIKPDKVRVRSYRVKISNGRVVVETGGE